MEMKEYSKKLKGLNSRVFSLPFSASKCKTMACSCVKSHIPCSKFCKCSAEECFNEWNNAHEIEEEEESDTDSEESDEDY